MRLAEGEETLTAFRNVQNQIVQDVQEVQLPEPVPILPLAVPFGHAGSKYGIV